MGSILKNYQIFWKIYLSNCSCICFGIGKTLLKKVTLDMVIVFKSFPFPLRYTCLLDKFFICFSISNKHSFQLYLLVSWRSLLKWIPSIFTNSYGFLICMCWIFLSKLYIFAFARGVTFVLDILIVAPVA